MWRQGQVRNEALKGASSILLYMKKMWKGVNTKGYKRLLSEFQPLERCPSCVRVDMYLQHFIYLLMTTM